MLDIEVRGIPCVFNEDALDDFEMLEKLALMEGGNVTAMVGFAHGIFGEEQMDNIKSQLRGEDGICRLSDVSEFIGECLQAAAARKKAGPKTSAPCPSYQEAPGPGARRPPALLRPEPRPDGRRLRRVPRRRLPRVPAARLRIQGGGRPGDQMD